MTWVRPTSSPSRLARVVASVLVALGAGGAAVLWTGPAEAAAGLTVACGDVSGPAGLIAAINAANASAGPSTIGLRPCAYVLVSAAAPVDPAGPDGLPIVSGTVTINGNGATIARSAAAPAFRILHVAHAANLTLAGLTISGGETAQLGAGILDNGNLAVTASRVRGNVSHGGGGGIGVPSGASVTITDSQVSGNSTPGPNDGGAIASGGSVVIRNSLVSDNSAASGAGGAIESFGTLDVSNSTFERNTAGLGGAIFDQSTASFSNSLFSGNMATGRGGAVFVDSGSSLSLSATVVINNRAGDVGGGVALGSGATLGVVGSLIIGNSSATGGGGLYAAGASVGLTTSLVIGNQPDNCEPVGVC